MIYIHGRWLDAYFVLRSTSFLVDDVALHVLLLLCTFPSTRNGILLWFTSSSSSCLMGTVGFGPTMILLLMIEATLRTRHPTCYNLFFNVFFWLLRSHRVMTHAAPWRRDPFKQKVGGHVMRRTSTESRNSEPFLR